MLAEQMGCQLSVQSMPGRGSTFTLAFPGSHPRRITPVTTTRTTRAD
jgi:signal transduction histidine kinase